MRFWNVLQAVIVGGTFLAAINYYDHLPPMIPMRWNIHGEIDSIKSKEFIYLIPGVMLLLQTLFGVLVKSVAKNPMGERAIGVITTATLGFLAIVQGILVAVGLGHQLDMVRIVCAGAALLIMIIGREMPHLPRNYWAGIRTPWTLASDFVWQETHRRAAIFMTRAGAVGAALTMTPWPWVGLVFALGGMLYPIYDSWRISKTKSHS